MASVCVADWEKSISGETGWAREPDLPSCRASPSRRFALASRSRVVEMLKHRKGIDSHEKGT